MYDIAIVGLGPAGATLARLLPENIRVIAIDKKQPTGDAGFHKPCGGLLAPDAQKILSRFDLTLPKSVLVDPQIFSVRTIDVKSGLVRHYQRFYMNLDRHKFDQWLRSLIPAHVDIMDNTVCTKIDRCQDGYELTVRADGKNETVTARYIVGADGANSIVRRTVFPDFKIRRYLSIQQWFNDEHSTPFYSSIFDPDATDCYAWGLSKDNSFIFGGAFELEHAREHFEKLKSKVEPFGFHLNDPQKTEACLVLRPSGPFDFCCGGKGAFFIGEAAGFISPSSLEGISFAFKSAYALSYALSREAKNPFAEYRKRTRRLRLKLVLKHLKSPFMYFPPLRKLVMKSGIKSISPFK